MSKTAAIPMDKEIQSFQFIFTGQQYYEIYLQKIECFTLVFQKRLFCDAKEPLLSCKTYAFGTQNNRFWNAKA